MWLFEGCIREAHPNSFIQKKDLEKRIQDMASIDEILGVKVGGN
jgi:hypothetical protein